MELVKPGGDDLDLVVGKVDVDQTSQRAEAVGEEFLAKGRERRGERGRG